jgi:hypothetical protein
MKRWAGTVMSILMMLSVLWSGLQIGTKPAYACSCVGGDALVKLNRSSAVFAGTVTEVGKKTVRGEVGRLRPYTFEVDRAWKGVTTKTVSLFSYDGDSASCGTSFELNEAYLIYSYQGEDGKLQTNLCNGNVLLSKAGDDLKLLGPAVVERAGLADSPPDSKTKSGEQTTWVAIVAITVVVLGFVLMLIRQYRSRG